MNPKIIKRIVAEANIREIISEYVEVKKTGNNYFCVCPFHDDHKPSMGIKEEFKTFRCFTCGAHGDVVTFVSKFEGITIDQACIKLAKKLNIPIDLNITREEAKIERLTNVMKDASDFYNFYLLNSEEGLKGLEYLKNRGITSEIIEKFKIGLAPSLSDGLYQYLKKKNISEVDMVDLGLVKNNEKNIVHDVYRTRIMFPLLSSTGAVVGFSGRIYTDSDQAKYINSNDNVVFHKSDILYNYSNAALSAKKYNKIFIFEGFMDVIAAYKAGVENCVATMGTALTKNHIKLLLSLTNNIVLCFDGDKAGISAMKKASELLSYENIIPESLVIPDNMDPDEYGLAFGYDKLAIFLNTKSENVFNQLYKLAYNKIVKGDISSIETFKLDVFDFLNNIHQDTLVDYFLNKLANDLEVSLDSIKTDFSKVRKQNNSYNQIPFVDNVEQPVTKQVYSSKVKVTVAVRRAYRIIIKHAIFDSSKLISYFDQTGNFYPGNDLALEFSILTRIKELEYQYKDLSSNPERSSFLLETIKKDPMYLDYLVNIYNDTSIDIKNNDDFNQCVLTVITYIHKVTTALQKNRVKNGEISAITDFVESKRLESDVQNEKTR